MNLKDAIKQIEKNGVLLVYPINNQPEPRSLWSEFYPKSKMRWEWDSGGDNRVAGLWHLREQLSSSGKVVYAKWYQGRATFFSKKVFTSFHYLLNYKKQALSEDALRILEVLDLNSPLSVKQVKVICEMKGKANERRFEKAMKELWTRLLIVGYGEVDDGAFPSLSVGSTRLLFEKEWTIAQKMTSREAEENIKHFDTGGKMLVYLRKKMHSEVAPPTRSRKKVTVIRFEDLQPRSSKR